ncbi:MAG: radical SAM protein [bacterium]
MGHIVLLFPHTGYNKPSEQILPLGLLYVSAPLVQKGHSVTIIDQRKEAGWRDALRRAVSKPQTLAVGITTMTGPQIEHAMEIAQAVRKMAPELPIVWGGVHPSLLPEQIVQSEMVDIACVGEGEISFSELIKALEERKEWSNVPGICYRKNGKIVSTNSPPLYDLEQLPPLPYDLLDLSSYQTQPLRIKRASLPVITSRGCRFRCAYCYNTKFYQCSWRGMSPEKVMEQITTLVKNYNAGGIFLLDDNFFGSRHRVEQIFKMLIESGLGVHIYNANCRVDFLHRSSSEFLQLMRRAGVEQIFVGVESGSDRVLNSIYKDIKVEQVLEINRNLRDAGIIPVYSFMAGLPGETRLEVEQTLELMVRLREENPQAKLYKLSLFVPMPGTDLFERCKEMGNEFPQRLEDWSNYDYDHVNLTYLSDEHRKFRWCPKLANFL